MLRPRNCCIPCGRQLTPLLVILGTLLSGCSSAPDYPGDTRHEVRGNVSLDGVPVVGGTVFFDPAGGTSDSRRRSGGPIVDGSYSIPEPKGPHSGVYHVSFSEEITLAPREPSTTIEPVRLPDEYAQGQSQLQVEITESPSVHNFHLTSD